MKNICIFQNSTLSSVQFFKNQFRVRFFSVRKSVRTGGALVKKSFIALCIITGIGIAFFVIPNIYIQYSRPIEIAKADAAPPEKGSASDESVTLNEDKSSLVNNVVDGPLTYDLPPEVSNATAYSNIEWNDFIKQTIAYPCTEFDIVNVDPGYVVQMKAVMFFKYQDRKYKRWFCIQPGTIIHLVPGRYFFPKCHTEFYKKVKLFPGEDALKHCKIEVYNLDRIVFTQQAILESYRVYETYFENPLFFPSKGF